MTPAARIAAVIELVQAIEADPRPAERCVADYLRGRRYIGAKDRRAVADAVFAWLRARARTDWWVARAAPAGEARGEARDGASGGAGGAAQARAAVLALLALVEGRAAAEIAALFDGSRYGPAPLSDGEGALVAHLAGRSLDDPAQPDWVRLECPEWLLPAFGAAFGGGRDRELAALIAAAPLDLRVNALKGDREQARAALADEGIEAAPTPLSPWGLRVAGRRAVTAGAAYRAGLIEPQDEGSQLVALLCDARPGLAVADLCAGGGGKTLALAAAMGNDGRLVALDRDEARLARARARLRRAGAGLAELHGPPDAVWLAAEAGRFDRVLIDAPCSGTGTWRRQPDARWRLTEGDLARYRAAQAALLDDGAGLLRPGGRLVYATCSLLPAENREQIAAFLAAHPDFAVVPAAGAWLAALGAPPAGLPSPFEGEFLTVTPARHGCDGFFAAVLAPRSGRA